VIYKHGSFHIIEFLDGLTLRAKDISSISVIEIEGHGLFQPFVNLD